jgi:plasmid stabilization system protein ParE
MQVVFRPEARDDVVRARQWYEARAVGLGSEFVRSLDAAISSVARNPTGFPLIEGVCRRVVLRRFPCSRLYLEEADVLVVLGCFHHRRDPRALTVRMSG